MGLEHLPIPYEVGTTAYISRDSRWSLMRVLLGRPWFGRGWVVQEAALGQTDTQVLWVNSEFSWLDLQRVHLWF